MVAIVPIVIQINSTPDAVHGEEYFINRVIRQNKNTYFSIGIESQTIENVKQVVENETKNLSDKLNNILVNADAVRYLLPTREELIETVSTFSRDDVFRYKDDTSVVLIIDSESIIIISKDSASAQTLVSQLDTDFKNISEITEDFGLGYTGLVQGEQYAKYRLNRLDLKDIKTIPRKNSFEEEVAQFVSTLTNCSISNVEMRFEAPNENFEYDILVPLSEDKIIDFEIKDYSIIKNEIHGDSESMKSKLILSPVDKATRLDASVVIVTKGFPQEVLEQMKEFARSRNVTLLNENNYKDEITSLLIKETVHNLESMSNIRRRKMVRTRQAIAKVRRAGTVYQTLRSE